MTGMFFKTLGTKLFGSMPSFSSIAESCIERLPNVLGKSIFETRKLRKAINQLPFSSALMNAKTEREIADLIKEFNKNNQEFYKSHPNAYDEICAIVRQRIMTIRAQNSYVA